MQEEGSTAEAAAQKSTVMIGPARTIVTTCLMISAATQTLDSSIANVALPYMQGSMSASQDEISWVLTSYIVSAAIMTAPAGFLANRFGRTRMFIIMEIGFTLASILCGAAQNLPQIVLFRIVQGAFGAGMIPISQAVMLDIYPVESRGWSMAVWTTGSQTGSMLGPVLGGWLTANWGWRWIFYVNVPFGVIAVIGLLLFMKESPVNRALRLDWVGFSALALALGAFQTMLDRGQTQDWFSSTEIIVEACLAGIGFYLFVVQSSLAQKPFLSPRLFTDRNLMIANVLVIVFGGCSYATMALLPNYLVALMNYPLLAVGFVQAPRSVGTVVSMMMAGRLVGRVPLRVLMAIGLASSVLSAWQMTTWTPDVTGWAVAESACLQGIGIGFIFVPVNVFAFATLPANLRNDATAVFSLARNAGVAVAISIANTCLARMISVNHAILTQFATPFNRALQTGTAAQLWNPASLGGASALDAAVTRQASIIAYADDFRSILLMSLLFTPVLFLVRVPGRNKVAAGE